MEEELDGTGTCTGMVTGIPSLQTKGRSALIQTLDKLARGITSGGNQKNYALVIVADPAKDAEISELQQKLLRVKSEIHTMAEYNETKGKTEGTSEGESKSKAHWLCDGTGTGSGSFIRILLHGQCRRLPWHDGVGIADGFIRG